ncbi:SDR family NAD(P)-dependent oxidoreductase [Pseudoglutamicibacter albus]|uniref:NAD(P)-dependent dehydrogenase (Short-subunit alcohol dehydrogenase family) n=1 Tax=Pseudoglutamicibacter albus TaxID=98671 RepID=A0ABU1YYL8_9MICC|nr:SDR family oxidoreductase [Pseudoglutamicibacter albus]MDR7292846.1 NAD(P)-dependent dehydrogenase (short-subunit alcohol dehydrogenase family) [Pseudoglutamicibacter albus]
MINKTNITSSIPFSSKKDQPRRVLVTGAGGGMCAGINEVLARAGHLVVCTDVDQTAVEVASERIRSIGGRSAAYCVDVTVEGSVAELAARVDEEFGGIDVLINAAGLLDRKYLVDHDGVSFDRVMAVNLNGPFRMIRHFTPGMVSRGWGRVINISSIAGTTGYPYPSYAASKAGLSNLTRSLLIDFWGTGVTVNNICPGVVDTKMVIQEVREQVKEKVPTQNIVDPQEIGAFIEFLLSDNAKNINGADLMIDGGATQIFRLFDDK